MPRKKSNELFADYYDEWIDVYKDGAVSDVTLKKYYITAKNLRLILPDTKIKDLDRRTYQHLINIYGKTHERQTVIDFHHQVKSCIKDMFYDGLIDKDPTYKAVIKGLQRGETRKRKHKYLEVDELRKLLQSLDLSYLNDDWFICITAKNGLRFAEALALTPNDFDWVNNTLTINKTWNYKTGKGGFKTTKTITSNRTIAIDWQIVGQFKPLIQDLPVDEPIFVPKDENGMYKKMYNSTFNAKLNKKCIKLKITPISLHGLRHTHASVLLANGVSIQSISDRLGHSDVSITQETYAHVLEELRQKDNQKMMQTLMSIS